MRLFLCLITCALICMLIFWASSFPQQSQISSAAADWWHSEPREVKRPSRVSSAMADNTQWTIPVETSDPSKPEHVFPADEKGYTASAHASTVVATPSGEVLAAWFGGTKEGNHDVRIYGARRSVDGKWSKPHVIAQVGDEAHWNPVLFWFPPPSSQNPSGTLWLHFKFGYQISHWQTYFSTSDDMGQTWSAAKELVPGDKGGRGCVKDKPLILANGDILAGASLENGPWRVFFDRSTDGISWEATDILKVKERGVGLIQPTLWQSSGTDVHALMRSDHSHVYRTDSKDGGRTWSPARSTKLPNNNSGLDIAQLSDGTLILAYNPVRDDWGPRYPLRLAISEDNGETWTAFWDIETEHGEFSYPAIVSWENSTKGPGFILSYTWNRLSVSFVSMSLGKLRRLATNSSPA